jgi:inhibitor of cysteine peptidase
MHVKGEPTGMEVEPDSRPLEIADVLPYLPAFAAAPNQSYLLGCADEQAQVRFQLRERTLAMPPQRFCPRLNSAFRLLLVALLALACRTHTARAESRVITDADKGALVQLKTGDILEVHLKSNPTTGYTWYVHPKSTPLLKLIGQAQTQAPQPGVGRPIFQIFRFQAVSAGNGVLLLHYVRSWEKPVPAEEEFDLHVSIR